MVKFEKSGVISADGNVTLKDKSGNNITNTYQYAHGFVEDNSNTQAMSVYNEYILATELIEY